MGPGFRLCKVRARVAAEVSKDSFRDPWEGKILTAQIAESKKGGYAWDPCPGAGRAETEAMGSGAGVGAPQE